MEHPTDPDRWLSDAGLRRIAQYGLEAHLEDLEEVGLTLLAPGRVEQLAPGLSARLQAAVRDVAAQGRSGGDGRHDDVTVVQIADLLLSDPCFQEAVVHPAVLALIDHELGEDCRLRHCAPLIRPSGEGNQPRLHCDEFPPRENRVERFTAHWLLADYGGSNGSMHFVPGSHVAGRAPEEGEGLEDLVEIEAPAGSLMIFHGHLWHGTAPRSAAGVRLGLHCLYNGPDSAGPFAYDRELDADSKVAFDRLLASGPARLRKLLGRG